LASATGEDKEGNRLRKDGIAGGVESLNVWLLNVDRSLNLSIGVYEVGNGSMNEGVGTYVSVNITSIREY
jgi:hypothetical protein